MHADSISAQEDKLAHFGKVFVAYIINDETVFWPRVFEGKLNKLLGKSRALYGSSFPIFAKEDLDPEITLALSKWFEDIHDFGEYVMLPGCVSLKGYVLSTGEII